MLIFTLPVIVFSCSLICSEFYFFLFILVTFYYSLIKKTNTKDIFICTFSLFFQFRVTSNSISLCSQQLKACSIFILIKTDNIFLVGAIDQVIKPIAKHIQ